MPTLETIEVYNALKERLGEESTRVLLKYIEETARANVATKEDLLLTRDELKDENTVLRQDVVKIRDELRADIAALDKRIGQLESKVGELDLKIEKLRVELGQEMAKTRWYVVIAAVIIVLTNPKVLEILGKAITAFR